MTPKHTCKTTQTNSVCSGNRFLFGASSETIQQEASTRAPIREIARTDSFKIKIIPGQQQISRFYGCWNDNMFFLLFIPYFVILHQTIFKDLANVNLML